LSTIRSFIAFELPKSVLDALSDVQKSLKRDTEGVRWVRPDSIHLTTNFLGDIPEDMAPRIEEALKQCMTGAVGMNMRLNGVGAFPTIYKPRVIWVGVEGDVPVMAEIKRGLDQALLPLGFEPEGRSFKPHLTIGRVKNPKNLKRLSQALEKAEVAERTLFMISRLVLYKSELFPDGARYTPLAWVEVE